MEDLRATVSFANAILIRSSVSDSMADTTGRTLDASPRTSPGMKHGRGQVTLLADVSVSQGCTEHCFALDETPRSLRHPVRTRCFLWQKDRLARIASHDPGDEVLMRFNGEGGILTTPRKVTCFAEHQSWSNSRMLWVSLEPISETIPRGLWACLF